MTISASILSPASSSTVRIPTIPLPTTTNRGRCKWLMLMLLSHARSAKDRRLAHVVPPVERDAGDVEQHEDCKREIGPTGCGNGGAEPARDEEAADGADCADEAERGPGFEPRCFERERAASLALALGFAQPLRAEDRGNRHIGRAIAEAGQSEKSQKHGEEAGKVLLIHEVDHA